MENVLMFPGIYAKKKSFVNPFKLVINKIKEKKEKDYKFKVEALRKATYVHFLNEIKKAQSEGIEIPFFLTAKQLTNDEIRKAEAKGRKHIEECYKDLKKRISKK